MSSLRVIHVNDLARVGSTLVAGLNAAGADAEFRELWGLGASKGKLGKALAGPARLLSFTMMSSSLRRAQPDVVHIHNGRQAFVGIFSGRPTVMHCHGTDVRWTRPGTRWGYFVGYAAKRAELVIVSTPDLLKVMHQYRKDIVYLPNPIDVDRFAEARCSPTVDVLVGGPLIPVKGGDAMIEAAVQVATLRPGTTFSIIEGPRAIELHSRLGPGSKIVPRAVRDELPGLVAGHRLAIGQMFLGTPGVFELECMAAGVPVAMPIQDPPPGRAPLPFLAPGPDDNLAEEVVKLLDDEVAQASKAKQSIDWVTETYSRASVVEQLLDLYARM